MSLAICPKCKGSFGVRRVPKTRRIGQPLLRNEMEVPDGDEFVCDDCGGYKFNQPGVYAAKGEMGHALAAG
jgi:hypothetical protein